MYEDDEGMEESGDYEYSGDFYEEGSSDKRDGGVQKPGQFFLVETKDDGTSNIWLLFPLLPWFGVI